MNESDTIRIRQIDHVVIRVKNLEGMIAWYRDVLGCELERGPGDFRLAQLRAGASLIDLVDANGPFGQKSGSEPDQLAPNMDHVCFQVHPWDTRTIRAKLDAHNVEYGKVEERHGATGLGPSIYLRDPEGNRIELKGVTNSL